MSRSMTLSAVPAPAVMVAALACMSASGAWNAANAQIEFDPAETYVSCESPWSLASGDFNNDELPDIVVAGWSNGEACVHLNNGDGTFSAGTIFDVGETTAGGSVAVDLNNDGWDDIATSNLDWNNASVLINNQDGTFAPAVTYPIGDRAWNIEAGDLNNDGWKDLVTANVLTQDVSVLINNQDGTFAASVPYAVAASPMDITIADLDGDEDMDIAVAHYSFNRFSVLKNNGDGTFAAPDTYTVGSGSRGVASWDADRDGDIDLVTANSLAENITILYNDGSGGFGDRDNESGGDGCYQVATADVDMDSDLDLLVANYYTSTPGVTVHKNHGDGTVAAEVFYGTGAGTGPSDIVVADFNMDGRPDFAVSNLSYDSFTVRLNTTEFPPVLSQGPLVRGQQTTFTVTGARANEKVYFTYSTRGVAPNGFCANVLGGMCLDLKSPVKQIGSRRADAGGTAQLTVRVPDSTPTITVWTQAAIIRGTNGIDSVKSNYVEDVVQ